ncbi:MAG: T9SS type A sorting domain-containing protein [Spirochaetes bacterium]|nr:T9SS type A sorting domain-containing protein [Spirochaetota bacterium]
MPKFIKRIYSVFVILILLSSVLYAVRPNIYLDRVIDDDAQIGTGNPPNPGTSQLNFFPDLNNSADSMVFVVSVTNTPGWTSGDYRLTIDINKDGLYNSSDWQISGSITSGKTNLLLWKGYNSSDPGSEGNYPWIVPSGIYIIQCIIDSNYNSSLNDAPVTNYINAAPYSSVLSGKMNITNSTNTSQVSLEEAGGSAIRYSKPVSNGETYLIYGLRSANYFGQYLFARNNSLPSVNGNNIFGSNNHIINLTSGSNTQNIGMNSGGKTEVTGKVYDYMSGDGIQDAIISFTPDTNFELVGAKEITSTDPYGNYRDYCRGNGNYIYIVSVPGSHGTLRGSIAINSNNSPITQNFYLGPAGTISIDIGQTESGVTIKIKDAHTDTLLDQFTTETNGTRTSTYAFSAGTYKIESARFSNTTTSSLFTACEAYITLLDGESINVKLQPEKGYRLWGTNFSVNDIIILVNDNSIDSLVCSAGARYTYSSYLPENTYKITAEPKFPFSAEQLITNIMISSNTRLDFNLPTLTNSITVVFSNWANYTNGGDTVISIGMKDGIPWVDNQGLIGSISSVTSSLLVDSTNDRYSVSVGYNSGGVSTIIQTKCSNRSGDTLIFDLATTPDRLSGIVLETNSTNALGPYNLFLFSQATQFVHYFSGSSNGQFSISNIAKPGPYTAIVEFLNDTMQQAYGSKYFYNITANTTVTLEFVRMINKDRAAPSILYLNPPYNNKSKDPDIRFYTHDNGGDGLDTNSISIEWLSGTGLDFGYQTLQSNRVTFSNGWVFFTNTGLSDANTIRIIVADLASPPNSNIKTNSFIIDTTPPMINSVSMTDSSGTGDNILGWNERPYHFTLNTAATGNYTVWLDNSTNHVFDVGTDWYLTGPGSNPKLKNILFTNTISILKNLEMKDEFDNAYNFTNLSDGQHQIMVRFDDIPSLSVNDGNIKQTNILIYVKTTPLSFISDEVKTVNSNTVKVMVNSPIHSFSGLNIIDGQSNSMVISGTNVAATNILYFSINNTIAPGDRDFSFLSINIKDFANNSIQGPIPIKDGINPTLLWAKSITTNIIQFRFDEVVTNNYISLSNKTVLSTNNAGTNIFFTVTPNFAQGESTNFSIIVHDTDGNTTNFSGKFTEGFAPQLTSTPYTFGSNRIIMQFNEPVARIQTLNIEAGKTVTATNFTSGNSNIIFTVVPNFGPDEMTNFSITVSDSISNAILINGTYLEKIRPRLIYFNVFSTNGAKLKFNEPLGISQTNTPSYQVAWISNTTGTPVTNWGNFPNLIITNMAGKTNIVDLFFALPIFQYASNAICVVTNVFDLQTNIIDTNFNSAIDANIIFDAAPGYLTEARTIKTNQIRFTFNKVIQAVSNVSISNKTVLGTNINSTEVIFTVGPNFSVSEKANFSLRVSETNMNEIITNGIFSDGLAPGLSRAMTVNSTNLVFIFNEPVTAAGSMIQISNHSIIRTNASGSNLMVTIAGTFKNNESTNFRIIAQDTSFNPTTNTGKFSDGIAPVITASNIIVIETNKVRYESSEPIFRVLNISLSGRTVQNTNFQNGQSNVIFTVIPNYTTAELPGCTLSVMDFSSNITSFTGTGQEQIRPRLLSFNVLSSNTAQLLFSESMGISTTNKMNYNMAWVSNNAGTLITNFNNFPVSVNIFSPDTVVLTFSPAVFNDATNAYCTVTNLYDVHNNIIDPGFRTATDSTILFDTAAPTNVVIISVSDRNNDDGGVLELKWMRSQDESSFNYWIYIDTNPITLITNSLLAISNISQTITNTNISGLSDKQDYYVAIIARDVNNNQSGLSGSAMSGPAFSVRNRITVFNDIIYSRLNLEYYMINDQDAGGNNINYFVNFEVPDSNLITQANSKLNKDVVDLGSVDLTADTCFIITVYRNSPAVPVTLISPVSLSLPINTALETWMEKRLGLFRLNTSSIEWELVKEGTFSEKRFQGIAEMLDENIFRILVLRRPVFENTDHVMAGPTLYTGDSNGIHFVNLTLRATIKVYTVNGTLVAELEETDGDGRYIWDTKGKSRYLGSGIYIVRVENSDDKNDFKVLKIAIVR